MTPEIYTVIILVLTLIIIGLYCKAKIMINRHKRRYQREVVSRNSYNDIKILNEMNKDLFQTNAELGRSANKLARQLKASQDNIEALTAVLNEKNEEIEILENESKEYLGKLKVRNHIIKSISKNIKADEN